MLLDSENLFCENQSITTGTIYSENIINFGKNDVSFAPLIIQVVNDFTKLTSLKVIIQTSETVGFEAPVNLIETSLKLSELKAGDKFPINNLPKGNKGFMRLAFVVSGTAETTGKITAGVVCKDGLAYHEI